MHRLPAAIIFTCLSLFASLLHAETRVIMLGTGTPVPDPERAGPGVAVVVDGTAYLFDAGSGVLQRAVQAAAKYAIPGLTPQSINHLFLTHLHSDHIHDVADLASSRWWSRTQRLALFGPAGLAAYNAHMTAMATIEADLRAAGTPPELVTDREGYIATATEVSDGFVYEDARIKVEAFEVPHGDIKPAYGYRITTADKTIVISGDTAYSPALAEQAKGADILIHEVMSGDLLATQSEFWQRYHGSSHTRASEVAQVANVAQPGLVVLYHILFFAASPADIVAEVTRNYPGTVVLANDLDEF